MPTSLIKLLDISVVYNEKKILDHISFSLFRNKITTLIGPNGAGKSTLVKTVIGLVQPTQGKIERQNDLKIGYVPQKLKLNENLPLRVKRYLQLCKGASLTDIHHALDLVGTPSLLNSDMHTLSGGETQRILLASALLKKPDLLVLDEPAQGVDISGQIDLYALISNLKDTLKCGILMVSHDLHLVMAKTDEVICLHHHICCTGTPDAISSHPEYLALFGSKERNELAIYQHNHNHQHDLSGDPVNCCQPIDKSKE